MYQSTKRYGHELGLSACFRQHKADSHCNLLHGYALSFKFVFEAKELDERNWVQDFGGLKELKQALMLAFDHKLLVAKDDPQIDMLCSLAGLGIADVVVMHSVGCEAFARHAFVLAKFWVQDRQHLLADGRQRMRVVSCEVAEHGANSAIYFGGRHDD